MGARFKFEIYAFKPKLTPVWSLSSCGCSGKRGHHIYLIVFRISKVDFVVKF